MRLAQDDFPLENPDTTGQPILFGISIPLIENVQFFGRGRIQVLHAADNLRRAGAAFTIETPCLHLDSGLLAGGEQELARFNVGRKVLRQYGNSGHSMSGSRRFSYWGGGIVLTLREE